MDRHRARVALNYRFLTLVGLVSISLACSARVQKTTEQRIQEFGKVAKDRILPAFTAAKINYPPRRIAFVGLKRERILEVYAVNSKGKWVKITGCPILAASGGPGPKLREGDRQVPEGIYKIDSLNPNSVFHVSLRTNYPNAFDRAVAKREGRTNLGNDIMIHGSNKSIGCLAMGDEVVETLFTLAHDVGLKNILVVLAPMDYRTVAKQKLIDPRQKEIAKRLRYLPK
jgi:murein L,D-transpeptidase YafK